MKRIIFILLTFMFSIASADTVKIVVSASPGGSIDYVARSLQTHLTNSTHTFNIEYRLGAGGIIAANYVAEDNQPMILVSSIGLITNSMASEARYDILRDFSYVGCAIVEPVFILVNTKSGIKTYSDFLLRSKEVDMPYSTVGVGSAGEIIAKHFFTTSSFINVPFKGGPEAIQALLSNTVTWTIESISATKALIDDGKLLPIAVNTQTRLADFPNVPTFKELKLDDKGFTRMQVIAINNNVSSSTQQYIFDKLPTFVVADGKRTFSCSHDKNFVRNQLMIYKQLTK